MKQRERKKGNMRIPLEEFSVRDWFNFEIFDMLFSDLRRPDENLMRASRLRLRPLHEERPHNFEAENNVPRQFPIGRPRYYYQLPFWRQYVRAAPLRQEQKQNEQKTSTETEDIDR